MQRIVDLAGKGLSNAVRVTSRKRVRWLKSFQSVLVRCVCSGLAILIGTADLAGAEFRIDYLEGGAGWGDRDRLSERGRIVLSVAEWRDG
jgi:hypothetical protein